MAAAASVVAPVAEGVIATVVGEEAGAAVEEALAAEGRFAVDNAIGSLETSAIEAAEADVAASRATSTVEFTEPAEPSGSEWFGRAKQTLRDVTVTAGLATAAVAGVAAGVTASASSVRGAIDTVKGIASDIFPDVAGDLQGQVGDGINRAIEIETKFAIGVGAVVVAWALFNR